MSKNIDWISDIYRLIGNTKSDIWYEITDYETKTGVGYRLYVAKIGIYSRDYLGSYHSLEGAKFSAKLHLKDFEWWLTINKEIRS